MEYECHLQISLRCIVTIVCITKRYSFPESVNMCFSMNILRKYYVAVDNIIYDLPVHCFFLKFSYGVILGNPIFVYKLITDHYRHHP